MNLGVLFWFYRDAVLCQNRVRMLRRRNPGIAVYGLYGGPAGDVAHFTSAVGPLLDDFWAFPDPAEAKWKWRNGDLVLARWHADRGERLEWDSVFVAQWDMVVTAPLADVLPAMAPGDMLLSGLRPVSEVAQWWQWTRWEKTRAEYDAFLAHVGARHGAVEDPMCCQFIGMVLPRPFLDRYAGIDRPELGFLEYKVPVYAQAFGIPLLPDTCFRPWWPEDPATAGPARRAALMHAWPSSLHLPVLLSEAARPGGRRVFHPYHGIYPHDLRSAAELLRHRRAERGPAPAAS